MKRLAGRAVVCLSFMALLFTGVGQPDSALSGFHLLVVNGNSISEVTPNGSPVRTINVPYPLGDHLGEDVRDVVVGPNGRYYVFNGTFHPFLSIFDPVNNTWAHLSHENWSITNAVDFGGVAVYQNFVYVPDERAGGEGETDGNGIVRFDLGNSSSQRFEGGADFFDLTIGQDGLLYALGPGGSPQGTFAKVYDPLSMELLWTVRFPMETTGIAVNKDGDIFVSGAFTDDHVYRFDKNGILLNQISTGHSYLYDVDLSTDGRLVISSGAGDVLVLNEALTSGWLFNVQGLQNFVAFLPITDAQPPALSNFQITPTKLPAKGGSVTFRVSVMDDTGVDSVKVENIEKAGGGIFDLTLTSGDATQGMWEVTLTALPNTGNKARVHNLTFIARDAAGREVRSQTLTLTVRKGKKKK